MLVIYALLVGSGILFLLYLKYGNKKHKEQLIDLSLTEPLLQTMRKLYPSWEANKKCREFCEKRLKLCLLILCIGSLAAFLYELSELNTHAFTEEGKIGRNTYGEGEKQIWLWVSGEEDEWREKIMLTVADQKYSREQITQLVQKAENDLVREIMGENTTLDRVTNSLNLVTVLAGYPFKIRWKSDHPLLLSQSGNLNQEKLKEVSETADGVLIELTAELTYEEFIHEMLRHYEGAWKRNRIVLKTW